MTSISLSGSPLRFLLGAFALAASVFLPGRPLGAAPRPLPPGTFVEMQKLFDFMGRTDAKFSETPAVCWNAEETAALVFSGAGRGLSWVDMRSGRKEALVAPDAASRKPDFAYGDTGRVVYFSAGRWWAFETLAKRFRSLDAAESRVADGRWDVHRAISGPAGMGPTTLVVRNDCGADVELYWKKPDGSGASYGRVGAGETREQSTFEGHSWEVRDSSGRVLDSFSMPAKGGVLTLTAPGGGVTEPLRGKAVVTAGATGFSSSVKPGALVVRMAGEEFEIPARLGQLESLAGSHPSPDGAIVAAVCLTKVPVRKLTYTESHPKGSEKPRVFSFEYAKPGDMIDSSRVTLFDVKARREIVVAPELFRDVWDFRPVGWSPDGAEFLVYLHYRTHKLSRFVAVGRDGAVRTVVEENADTFIDYSQKGWYFVRKGPWQLLWASERDGRNHIYRFDLKTGELLNRVTGGDAIVRSVERVDEDNGTILYSALGVRPGEDPYYPNLVRANLDGTGIPVVLTSGDGFHTWSFSPNRKFLVDRWSRVDAPPCVVLRGAETGAKVCDIVTHTAADIPKGYPVPERFSAKGRDGKTDIYGVIYRPSFHRKGDRLPVIEYIYAGPHGYHVPKGWGARDMFLRLSEQGYAVVVIDGMGSNWRDRAFHDVCYKNIKDAGFPDRIAWMKAAATKYPELDISKVGIIGGSAGGQNAAAALIWHNDFYKVAVADCGCHDNRIDKIWWNEAWMGWPIGPEYSESSNIDNASKLKGDILLLLGEIDSNVDVVSTYNLVDAFKRNGTPHELYVVPGGGHFVYFDNEAFLRVSRFFAEKLPVPKRL